MDKRQFLKNSGILIAGTALSRFVSGQQPAAARTNWAGNYQYSTDRLLLPQSIEEVQKAVKSCAKLTALGARHSFNGIADSRQNQISLKQLDQMVLDPKSRTVTVGAGVTYGKLAPYIDGLGFAVHNLASLPHVSVAGACATATHGSGSKIGNLSTAVSALELVTADGEVITLSREKDGDRFLGAVVALGGLGVVTKVTLDVQPTFQVRQVVYENLSLSQLEHHLDDIFLSGYSVSLFTDWQNHRATQVWIKRRVEPGATFEFAPEFYGAKLATQKLHPLAGHSAENCTEQLGIPGPWYERLPHFRMNFTPSSGAELQSEYFVPRDRGYEAILAVEKLRDQVGPHSPSLLWCPLLPPRVAGAPWLGLFRFLVSSLPPPFSFGPSLFLRELRTIDADDLWMSTCYKRPSMTIHFTWKPEWPAVKQLLPQIEAALAPFDARPHWAKLFTMPPSRLKSLYAKLPEYQDLLKHYDPRGKFRNEFLDTNIYGG